MTDNELDEMLDQWKAPRMRDSLREELRTGFAAATNPPARKNRFSRLAMAGIAAAVVLFAITQVSPKTVRSASPGFRIPFYVEFEFLRYGDDGSVPFGSRITSFPYAGHEINMSVTESGPSLLNTFRGIASSIRNQIILMAPSLVLPKEPPMTEPAWFAGFVRSGCSTGRNVVGHEIIAGHETTMVENGLPRNRFRLWMAPDLDCFALKLTVEYADPNGGYRIKIRKEAIKVTMNP